MRYIVTVSMLAMALLPMTVLTSAQSLRVLGEEKKELNLTIDSLDKLGIVHVLVEADSGQHDVYSGVPLTQVLALVDAPSGEKLRGKNLTKYLLIEARDGYKVLFSLAEIDGLFKEEQVILADKKNGIVLSEREGPFRVVVGGEKRKARYIRNVTGLKIGDVESR